MVEAAGARRERPRGGSVDAVDLNAVDINAVDINPVEEQAKRGVSFTQRQEDDESKCCSEVTVVGGREVGAAVGDWWAVWSPSDVRGWGEGAGETCCS